MICLLCLPLLAIWTSPKSNVSMVNWLVYCRFDLHGLQDSMAGPDNIQQKPKKLLQALPVHAQLISSILLASVIFASLYQ